MNPSVNPQRDLWRTFTPEQGNLSSLLNFFLPNKKNEVLMKHLRYCSLLMKMTFLP